MCEPAADTLAHRRLGEAEPLRQLAIRLRVEHVRANRVALSLRQRVKRSEQWIRRVGIVDQRLDAFKRRVAGGNRLDPKALPCTTLDLTSLPGMAEEVAPDTE
jgi:hypothetical protein